MTEQYDITGMSCAVCSARVEKAVRAVEGVTECSVNLLTNSMTVEGDATPDAVIAAVRAAGYGASQTGKETPKSEEKRPEVRRSPRLLRRLVVSGLLLLALMYLSMGHVMWQFPLPAFLGERPFLVGLCQMLLAASVMVINRVFFVNGAKALLHRAPNMDTLVSLGSLASFGYSVYVLIALLSADAAGDHVGAMSHLHDLYFESAAMIVTLITLGKLLEARAKGKTTTALEALLRLAPKTATVLREGREITVAVEELAVGDIFLVRPGEQIPTDGEVVDGQSAVNESALTGESLPVDKEIGSSVFAGTMNESGFLRCRATRVGEDTTLSQIIRMVSDASASKAPIAKAADRVSGIFVPVVLAIALVTLTVWLAVGESIGFAVARAVSVLVISCPCALGLATPVAIMVGTGMGAKHGILFKTAASLETAGRIGIVVLDKTGTITQGDPSVVGLYPREGVQEGELLSLAAALEEHSEHPLSAAIRKKAEEERVDILSTTEFSVLPGRGLSAKIGEERLLGGSLSFIESQISVSDDDRARAVSLAKEGKTPLLFARGDRLFGIIAVADTLKADSKEAVGRLRRMGLRVVMLTGDNENTAREIARQVGIDEVVAGVLPGGKEAVIRELQKEGKVAMVGDGINDAPALTAADLGLAIGAGTDVAIDAADTVLVKSRLSDVPDAILLGKATLRNIRQNLFWAFLYNVIGIPLAAGVWIPLFGWTLNPMFGAAAMSLSSVTVVGNALRLNFWHTRQKEKR